MMGFSSLNTDIFFLILCASKNTQKSLSTCCILHDILWQSYGEVLIILSSLLLVDVFCLIVVDVMSSVTFLSVSVSDFKNSTQLQPYCAVIWRFLCRFWASPYTYSTHRINVHRLAREPPYQWHGDGSSPVGTRKSLQSAFSISKTENRSYGWMHYIAKIKLAFLLLYLV